MHAEVVGIVIVIVITLCNSRVIVIVIVVTLCNSRVIVIDIVVTLCNSRGGARSSGHARAAAEWLSSRAAGGRAAQEEETHIYVHVATFGKSSERQV